MEDAYRTMLLGIAPNPTLLGKATDKAFRQFVEDMLQLLTHSLNSESPWQPAGPVRFSRQDVVQIITALIENAAPSADKRTRCRRYSRGLVLWATLLGLASELEGHALEQSSRRWPLSLRRRFVSAKYHRIKKRWPYSPYGSSYSRRIERREIAAIYGLSLFPTSSAVSRSLCGRPDFASDLDTDRV